jgi:SAM-dependent methyltransferase
MNDPVLIVDWAKEVIDTARTEGIDIEGAKVLEIGPGHSLGLAVALLAAGAAKSCVVDVIRFADINDIDPLQMVLKRCEEEGLSTRQSYDIRKILRELNYYIVKADKRYPIEDNEIDVSYSFYAGEHIRDVKQVLREVHRVLKPGGVCTFAIDLRDHFHFEGNWLNFLRYEPRLWESMCSHRGKWSNRLLAPDWRTLFGERFEITRFEELCNHAVPVDFDQNKLATQFRKHDIKTLTVSHLCVVARKRHEPTM